MLAAKYHSLRLLTCAAQAARSPGVAGAGHEALGLRAHAPDRGARDRRDGRAGRPLRRLEARARAGLWQFQYMFSLGLIIGGGTAQIQKNIIAERGLGMPREPRTRAGVGAEWTSDSPTSRGSSSRRCGATSRSRADDARARDHGRRARPRRQAVGGRSPSSASRACSCPRRTAAAGSRLLDAALVAESLGLRCGARARSSRRP